jgi:hypothetical protein
MFQKYLAKVNNSIVLMQKGSVACKRCCDMLNLRECELLCEQILPIHKEIRFEVAGVVYEAIVTKQQLMDLHDEPVQTLLFTAGPREGLAKAKLDLNEDQLLSGTSTLRMEVSEGTFSEELIPWRIKTADPDFIVFKDVELTIGPPKDVLERTRSERALRVLDQEAFYGLGPLGGFKCRLETVKLPLGKVVYVQGASAPLRLSFLSLAAGVVKPTRGMVRCPSHAWSVMLPPTPAGAAHLTVLEALCMGGQSETIARNLICVLGMNPDQAHDRLSVGQVHMIQMARALLRNPEVLVIIRPLDFVELEYRHKIGQILRMWQSAGFEAIVNWLANGPEVELSDEMITKGHARTLIITGMELPGDPTNDAWLDLDMLLFDEGGDPGDDLDDIPRHGTCSSVLSERNTRPQDQYLSLDSRSEVIIPQMGIIQVSA